MVTLYTIALIKHKWFPSPLRRYKDHGRVMIRMLPVPGAAASRPWTFFLDGLHDYAPTSLKDKVANHTRQECDSLT